jgi:uncharacterized membrane protein
VVAAGSSVERTAACHHRPVPAASFAALGDTSYDLVLVLHILAVVVAFAPAVAHPLTGARVKQAEGDEGVVRFSALIAKPGRWVYFPALVLSGVFGGALIGLSKPDADAEVLWKFEQTWIWLGIAVWVVLCGLVSAVILPGERKVAAGDLTAQKRVQAAGGMVTLLVVVQVGLMVFKPGL